MRSGVGAGAIGLHGVRHLVGAGLGVGVAYGLARSSLSIAKVPLIVGYGVAWRRIRGAGELRGRALAYSGEGEVASRCVIDRDTLCFLVGAMPTCRDGEGHLIGAGIVVSVGHCLALASLAVTEVPVVAVDSLSRGVGGGGTGEGGGVTYTNRSEGEVGSGHGINDHLCGGTVGLATDANGACVGASHGHGAVRTGGILLVRAEVAGTSPVVRGTCLALSCQRNSLTHAIRATVIDQRRQDTAVGCASADV